MRSVAKTFRHIPGAFVTLAFAVSPVAALAGAKVVAPVAEMTADAGAPCDMPCDDCSGDARGAACAVACIGLTVAVPATTPPAPSMPAVARIEIPAKVPFIGRDREPDKPPPKLILA